MYLAIVNIFNYHFHLILCFLDFYCFSGFAFFFLCVGIAYFMNATLQIQQSLCQPSKYNGLWAEQLCLGIYTFLCERSQTKLWRQNSPPQGYFCNNHRNLTVSWPLLFSSWCSISLTGEKTWIRVLFSLFRLDSLCSLNPCFISVLLSKFKKTIPFPFSKMRDSLSGS